MRHLGAIVVNRLLSVTGIYVAVVGRQLLKKLRQTHIPCRPGRGFWSGTVTGFGVDRSCLDRRCMRKGLDEQWRQSRDRACVLEPAIAPSIRSHDPSLSGSRFRHGFSAIIAVTTLMRIPDW